MSTTKQSCLTDTLEFIARKIGKRNPKNAEIIRRAKTILVHHNSALMGLIAHGKHDDQLGQTSFDNYEAHLRNANRTIREFGEKV